MDKQLKNDCWRVFSRISKNYFVMSRTVNGVSQFSPLYLHIFQLLVPRKLLDAQLFNQKYRTYEEIDSIPDKLRWCRHSKGLTQEEVANAVDIYKRSYAKLEIEHKETPSLDKMERLAAFFEIPVYDLLDDYNLFLYRGQAQQVRSYRERLGMTVPQFAQHHNIHPSYIYKWENGTTVISRKMWELCFSENCPSA